MNSAATSKINWTSLIIAMIGLSVALDLVPQHIEKPLIEVTLIAGPALIAVFRTD